MKIKLKTWERMEKELKPIAKSWKYGEDNTAHVEFTYFGWVISEKFRKEYFGKTLDEELRRTNANPNFTHMADNIHTYFHEWWFENDFIKEEEMNI